LDVKATGAERIIVALDVPTETEALTLAASLKDHAGLFKVGLELLMSAGVGVVPRLTALGVGVFLDAKFHDIPNTVAQASRAATRLGAAMFTVHALGGSEMLRAAVEAAHEEASKLGCSTPLVLAVTILTSLDHSMLADELGIPRTMEDQVAALSRLALSSGVRGVVASPQEVACVLSSAPGMTVVTPGVRPAWAGADDQRRTATPGEAVRRGAGYVVVGRPITRPPRGVASPVEAATRVAREIEQALAGGEGE
jgi:orotidine-5'-phosphate decarboxylase